MSTDDDTGAAANALAAALGDAVQHIEHDAGDDVVERFDAAGQVIPAPATPAVGATSSAAAAPEESAPPPPPPAAAEKPQELTRAETAAAFGVSEEVVDAPAAPPQPADGFGIAFQRLAVPAADAAGSSSRSGTAVPVSASNAIVRESLHYSAAAGGSVGSSAAAAAPPIAAAGGDNHDDDEFGHDIDGDAALAPAAASVPLVPASTVPVPVPAPAAAATASGSAGVSSDTASGGGAPESTLSALLGSGAAEALAAVRGQYAAAAAAEAAAEVARMEEAVMASSEVVGSGSAATAGAAGASGGGPAGGAGAVSSSSAAAPGGGTGKRPKRLGALQEEESGEEESGDGEEEEAGGAAAKSPATASAAAATAAATQPPPAASAAVPVASPPPPPATAAAATGEEGEWSAVASTTPVLSTAAAGAGAAASAAAATAVASSSSLSAAAAVGASKEPPPAVAAATAAGGDGTTGGAAASACTFPSTAAYLLEPDRIQAHMAGIVATAADPYKGCFGRLFAVHLPTHLHGQRDAVFALAKTAFDPADAAHRAVFPALYEGLTKQPFPATGSVAWTAIGFQRDEDFSTDLRGGGMLGPLQMLWLLDAHPAFAAALHAASAVEARSFPLMAQSISITGRQVLPALRMGRLNRLIVKVEAAADAHHKATGGGGGGRSRANTPTGAAAAGAAAAAAPAAPAKGGAGTGDAAPSPSLYGPGAVLEAANTFYGAVLYAFYTRWVTGNGHISRMGYIMAEVEEAVTRDASGCIDAFTAAMQGLADGSKPLPVAADAPAP